MNCEKCNGTGEAIEEKHLCDCLECFGSGLRPLQLRDWLMVYADPYEGLQINVEFSEGLDPNEEAEAHLTLKELDELINFLVESKKLYK